MDNQQRQRTRPSFVRTPSRASTIASNPRSMSSSNSFSVSSTSIPTQQQTQFSQQGISSATSAQLSGRPTPQLSREASAELSRQPAVSSLLQERLQKERRAESDKLGSSASSQLNFDMSASLDLGRASDRSSVRGSEPDVPRPQSSAGLDAVKKKGLGVKEMEQVVSTLHKQNFDLKLELFHRRERQNKLEERAELLEAENKEMQEMNHKLMDDLEKRDKAVEEAVAMIVSLEARVDQLITERNIVQQVDRDVFFSRSGYNDTYNGTPSIEAESEMTKVGDELAAASIHRMPSFLSEKSATTENLRHVYLGARSSMHSLRRVSEGPSEVDNALLNGLQSPTLSVLSESSFVSVYGQRSGDTTMVPEFDEPFTLPGVDGTFCLKPNDARSTRSGASHLAEPNKSANVPVSRSQGVSQHQATPKRSHPTPAPQQGGVHLQGSSAGDWTPTRPGSRGTGTRIPANGSQFNSPSRRQTKEEKRAALRKVMTDSHGGGVRLHDHVLPPTPDTIASSTLRRFKTSNDTLSAQQETQNEHGLRPLPERPSGHRATSETQLGVPLKDQSSFSRERLLQAAAVFDPYAGSALRRPRSAGETTASHRRRDSWNSEDYNSDDARSLQSSLDIWIRDGGKPSRAKGRTSPDLFGFPTSVSNGGWATNVLSDPKSNAMFNSDNLLDLLSLREALFSPNLPPPAPNRRSSLHAQTGSGMNTALGLDGTWPSAADMDAHHERSISDAADLRAGMHTPVQHKLQQQPSSDNKKNYPPTSWQQGPRAGFNKLFRRSIDKGSAGSVFENNPGNLEATSANSTTEQGSAIDLSPWVTRSGILEADRSGATPPPIMLKPRQAARRNSVSVAGGFDNHPSNGKYVALDAATQGAERIVPPVRPQSVAHTTGPNAGAGTGARRKWLPAFGRAGNNNTKK